MGSSPWEQMGSRWYDSGVTAFLENYTSSSCVGPWVEKRVLARWICWGGGSGKLASRQRGMKTSRVGLPGAQKAEALDA